MDFMLPLSRKHKTHYISLKEKCTWSLQNTFVRYSSHLPGQNTLVMFWRWIESWHSKSQGMLPPIQQICLIRVVSDVKNSFSWTPVQHYEACTRRRMVWEGTLRRPLKNRQYTVTLTLFCNAPCLCCSGKSQEYSIFKETRRGWVMGT